MSTRHRSRAHQPPTRRPVEHDMLLAALPHPIIVLG